jgi:S-adenosylmethionine-diacylglycerol 3-amino-3-carboxypropyl transferase
MVHAQKYFSTLNYTLANEDTSLEVELLPENTDTILSIAGSGGRILPLLSRSPKRVLCVDLAEAQLALTELRLSLAREASLAEFLAFFGYPHADAERSPEKLRQHWVERLELRSETREFCKGWLASINWQAPLYEGRWEKTFQKLSRMVRAITGSAGQGLFDCRTLEEQTEYLASKFPHTRWQVVLALLGNAAVFNALLYKGSFPKKNLPGSRMRFYQDAYARLFAISPARENFFLQLSFLGELRHPEGNPVECDPVLFARAKSALQRAEITYARSDAIEAARNQQGRIGFFSFSDVPSYFQGETERQFMQQIRPGLADQALVVVRNYLHIPERCDLSAYLNLRQHHSVAIAREKVQVYDVDVFQYQRGSTAKESRK